MELSSPGNVTVTVALAPGARFVSGAVAETGNPEPGVAPAIVVTCGRPLFILWNPGWLFAAT
jgi:hypothetical protein